MNDFNLDENEQVVAEIRRHWINVFPSFAIGALMLILAAAIAYGAGRYSNDISAIPVGVIALVPLLLVILAGVVVSMGLWVYKRNKLILTNLHLVRVEQMGLFSRRVSQLSLSRVQDVNGYRRGILATMLDFGNVEVQTAGKQEEFVYEQVPSPAVLADQLMRAHDQYMRTASASTAPQSDASSATLGDV